MTADLATALGVAGATGFATGFCAALGLLAAFVVHVLFGKHGKDVL